MNFKKNILILLTLLFVLSCEQEERCKIDQDCSSGDFCYSGKCWENLCESFNYDCGTGQCYMRSFNYPACKCLDGHYYSTHTPNSRVNKCYKTYVCEDSTDCKFIKKVGESEYFRVCSTIGECTNYCETNNDCIGENEVCVYNKGCYDKDTEYKEYYVDYCEEGYYHDPYNSLICIHECGNGYSCSAGYSCNDKNQCVPKCLTDDDCLNDKFTGNICDETLKICVY
jgi:hypothetical protein